MNLAERDGARDAETAVKRLAVLPQDLRIAAVRARPFSEFGICQSSVSGFRLESGCRRRLSADQKSYWIAWEMPAVRCPR
jgi:hypothetical protein